MKITLKHVWYSYPYKYIILISILDIRHISTDCLHMAYGILQGQSSQMVLTSIHADD